MDGGLKKEAVNHSSRWYVRLAPSLCLVAKRERSAGH